jgi:Tfp pilus assembly protein PilE
MTLTEIMVVLVIAIILLGVLVPSLTSFFLLDQHRAAKELALLYEQLHDEAVMRNVTFRIEYDLAAGTYQVQAAESGALIFDNARARQEWAEAEERRQRNMSEEELAAHKRRQANFAKLEARFKTDFKLPSGTVFGGFYTPQYEEMVHLRDLDEDNPKVWSYVFPNGQSEHTVIWIGTEGEEEQDGYTIEVEPLSGAVKLHGRLIEWDESYDFVPDEAPDLAGI